MNGNGSAEGAELVAQENYSLSNNSHDPHCYVRADLYNIPAEVCQCCVSIAKARTDEREQAALRVAGISSWPDAESNDPFDRLCRWHGAVAAARGEES